MVIHLIHHPVSAKKFVEPLVKLSNSNGGQSELWLEKKEELTHFVSVIDCPKCFAKFDITSNPLAVIARLLDMVKRFRRLKPTAIVGHQTRAAFIPLLSALIARVSIRVYWNGGAPYLGYRGPFRALLWLLEFLNCCFATHVLTVSHSIRDKMIQHHVVGKFKCQVIGQGSSCGIDLAEFSPEQFDAEHMIEARQAIGVALDAYVVLYVGRPVKRKGFHTLLSTWRYMRSSMSSNRKNVLLLAGCNNKDVVNAAGSKIEDVIALGYLTDLRPCYAACDVVVLPSWHEGFPYSLLEGAAAARPLIGSNIPGIDSIIMDKKNGLLVPAGSPEALAESLLLLRDNHDLRNRMGCYGRRYVEQYFDRKVFNQLLLDYYSRIGIE